MIINSYKTIVSHLLKKSNTFSKNFEKPIDKIRTIVYNSYRCQEQLADMAQLVEHILGKDEVTSSNLVISSTPLQQRGRYQKIPSADMAQLVEHILGKDEVTSSNLVISSKNPAQCAGFLLF